MNIKTAALFAGAVATVVAAILGRACTQQSPSSPVPVQITTSGTNSPAIIATGNVNVQYGVPQVLLTQWEDLAASKIGRADAKSKLIDDLKAKYLAIRTLVEELIATEPRTVALRSRLEKGDLEGARSQATQLAQSAGPESANNARQLTFLAEQIRILQEQTSVRNSAVGVAVVTETAPQTKNCIASVTKQVRMEPVACRTARTVGDDAWYEDVDNGIINFVHTGLIPTGLASKPVIFALYREPEKGKYCSKPVYSDTGLAVLSPLVSESCESHTVGWARGTTAGLIRFFPDLNRCQELTWNQDTLILEDTIVECDR